MGGHSYDVVSSEVLVESPILALRRDMVRMPGGEDRVSAREIVEHFGAVAVVAVDDRGRVALVRQWRQAAGRRLLELPAGLLDVAGEDPLEAAARELAEEAGLAAGRWSLLADLVTSPGFAEEAVRIYLAEDLERVDSDIDLGVAEGEEAELGLEFIDLDRACAMVGEGGVLNGIAVAGLFAAARVVAGTDPRRPADERLFDLRPTALAERRTRMLGGGDLKRVPDDATSAADLAEAAAAKREAAEGDGPADGSGASGAAATPDGRRR
ncbi:NUDIX domain-containing protein [Corynebacterium sp. 335C]